MILPLYNLFGDNLVLQVAVNSKAKVVTRGGQPHIEFNDDELRIVLDTASGAASRFEAKNQSPVPMSKNDKTPWEKAIKQFGFTLSDPLSKILKNFDIKQEKVEEIDNVPSFIKPEYYEFVRVPGKPGGKRASFKVDPRYVILAAAGWILSRVGYAELGEKGTVGINVFTTTPSWLHKDFGRLPGVAPITALLFLLASKAIATNSSISVVKVFFVSDASGKEPTKILSEFTADLTRILEKKDLVTRELIDLAEDALSCSSSPSQARNAQKPVKTKSDTCTFSAKVIDLIYEYIHGARRAEDIAYYTNRYISVEIRKVKTGDFCKENRIYCEAYRYAQRLLRETI